MANHGDCGRPATAVAWQTAQSRVPIAFPWRALIQRQDGTAINGGGPLYGIPEPATAVAWQTTGTAVPRPATAVAWQTTATAVGLRLRSHGKPQRLRSHGSARHRLLHRS